MMFLKWPNPPKLGGKQLEAIAGALMNLAVVALAAFGATAWHDGGATANNAFSLLLYGAGGAELGLAALLLLGDNDKED